MAGVSAGKKPNEAAVASDELTRSKYAGARAAGHIYAGHVALHRDDLGRAKQELELAMAEAPKIEGPLADFARLSLQPYFDKLRGAIALHAGRREQARDILKSVQQRLRAIPGPDAWMQALFELESIARIAQEAGDWELVEYTAKQMLDHDSAYGGGHYLMARVAEHNGDSANAARYSAEAKKYWSFADKDLPELKSE